MDFSEFSTKSYEYAHSIAQRYGAKLFVEHVVQPLTMGYPYYAFPESVNQVYWDLTTDAAKHLKEVVQKYQWNGIHPEFFVQEGFVTDSILAFAEKQSVDLIVMGTHGRRGIDRLTMGSVTEQVLRKAHCPVLAVRRPAHDFVQPFEKTNPVKLHKILFCTDFSKHSERAFEYAHSLAVEFSAEITILHVMDDIPASSDVQAETSRALAQLEKAVPMPARGECKIKATVRIGKPYEQIIQAAVEAQTDLVVMGVRGRNALDLALFGSTTHRVIQLGPCPVLAVHI